MLSILIDRYLKNPKLHNAMMRYGFFLFHGITTGVLMNDMMRVLFGDLSNKANIGYALSFTALMSGYISDRVVIFSNPLNNVAFGTGLVIANYWSNKTENKEKII